MAERSYTSNGRAIVAALAMTVAGCQVIFGFEDGVPADSEGGDGGGIAARLSSLEVSRGVLDPPFDPDVTEYTLALDLAASDLIVTPTAESPDDVSIDVAGATVMSGTASPMLSLTLGDNVVEVSVTPTQGIPRVYTVTANRGVARQTYVKASNTGAGDLFGESIAFDGDTFAIGVPREASSATGIDGDQNDDDAAASGAVYVFVRDGDTWSQQAYLKSSNSETGDFFGDSVALSGDTLAVGATGEDSSATGIDGDQSNDSAANSGAVFVFRRTGDSWAQEAYIKASNTEANDVFGRQVALSGDTLAVGGEREDSAATGVGANQANNSAGSSGAAWVFVRNGTTWSQQAYIKPSNTGAGDNFGRHLALSGDTLVVGAFHEDGSATGIDGADDDNATDAGAAYVFNRVGQTWTQQAYLKASNAGAGDQFGFTVAVDGDTVVVSSPTEDSAATGFDGDESDDSLMDSGAVYVFVRSGQSWTQQAYLKASNPDPSDSFGFGVTVFGDVVGVSARAEDSSASGVGGDQSNNDTDASGAVYLFLRSGQTWAQQIYLKASPPGAGDGLGHVMLSNDALVVGAADEDSAAVGIDGDPDSNLLENSGAVYVFE